MQRGEAPRCCGAAGENGILRLLRPHPAARTGGRVEQLLPIIIGLAILWVVWKVVKGTIRLVIMLAVIAAVIYFVLPLLLAAVG
ncbi:MAG: hypothetical protein RLZZ387_4854 [Chloroflexota bacterium]